MGVNRTRVQSIAEMRKVLESKPAVIALQIIPWQRYPLHFTALTICDSGHRRCV